MDPSSLLLGRTFLGRQSRIIRAIRSLRMVNKRAPAVGRDVRSPCSELDESEDDGLCFLLRDEWSVDSWSAEDLYGTSCAQLDNFDWVMPAGCMVIRSVFCPD